MSLPERTLAALDLGSNSFHMIIARWEQDRWRIQDRLRESVRLAAGLDAEGRLDEASQQRALDCLRRFGQRLRALGSEDVRAVGTNALRQARNGESFLRRASEALGHPIEVISGFEEARLVYLGVAYGLAAAQRRRLVIDIGGGSTELIIGEGNEARRLESLHMGCVDASRRFFPGGRLDEGSFRAAELAAERELEAVERAYRAEGWDEVVGASGTVKAVARVLLEQGWGDGGIDAEGLVRLRRQLVKAGDVEQLRLKGLSEERRPVMAGGLAVLLACFRRLGLGRMAVSDSALREGLLLDLHGRLGTGDVREKTVASFLRRYHCDRAQAGRVRDTAEALLHDAAADWKLQSGRWGKLLGWAAALHELGLDIAHSSYHKHGAYVLACADMAGFSRQEQWMLSTLVRLHRRRFNPALLDAAPEPDREPLRYLVVLLRLAVLLHRSRDEGQPAPRLRAYGPDISLEFPPDWLAEHPLLAADLAQEAEYLAEAGLSLTWAEA